MTIFAQLKTFCTTFLLKCVYQYHFQKLQIYHTLTFHLSTVDKKRLKMLCFAHYPPRIFIQICIAHTQCQWFPEVKYAYRKEHYYDHIICPESICLTMQLLENHLLLLYLVSGTIIRVQKFLGNFNVSQWQSRE